MLDFHNLDGDDDGIACELYLTRQFQERATQTLEEARRVLRTVKGSNGYHLSEGVQDYLLPSAAYGFLLAPFLRPELSAEELDSLTMAEFLATGTGPFGVPIPRKIAEALFEATTANPATLTGPQAELARVLLRPESNELVFQMATAPACRIWGRYLAP